MYRYAIAVVVVAFLMATNQANAYTILLYDGSTQTFDSTTYPAVGFTQDDHAWASGSETADMYAGCGLGAVGSGYPIFWDTTSVEFVLGVESADLFYYEQEDAVENAINEWDGALADSLLDVTWGGNTNNDLNTNDGDNTITFGTVSGWSGIGKTLFRLSVAAADSGEILEADIILNDDKDWTDDTYDCSPETYDIESVVAHEIGHALGLSHTCASCLATMDANGCDSCEWDTENLELRTLASDDIDGIEEIYGLGNGDGKYVRSEAGSAKRLGVNGVPTSFEVVHSYPNPFNPETVLTFSLNRPEAVSIVIYGTSGQIVDRVITNKHLVAGSHSIRWTPDQVASGVYVVELRTSASVTTKKVTLLR